MKKWTIWLIGMFFLTITFACDPSDNGNGCDGSDDTNPGGSSEPVPTCGTGVVDSSGIYRADRQLFVNWNGPGAPKAPSNHPGFGQEGLPRPMNAYSWSMVSFGGQLYVGTLNRLNDKTHQTGDISEGTEIWRYQPGPTVNSGTWQLDIAPGFGNLSNFGVRAMAVYNDQLFASTFNREKGTELWRRTLDTAAGPGQWKLMADGGFGDVGNDSVRAMAVFNGKLYLGMKNNQSGASLFKYDAQTEAVSLVAPGASGFRDTEDVISELVSYEDYLWIFTWGSAGFGAYRMDREENIQRASEIGMDNNNSGIMSSAVFNGKIYIGTVNLLKGAQLFVLANPLVAAPKDATWSRLGANVFQVTEKYLWRMQAFAGQLYIGTWNPYDSTNPLESLNNIGATLYRMDKNEGFCQVIGNRRLIEEGFGQSENYGIRSMTELNGRLYIGTAQPYKIEPGVDSSNAANREGTEVWEFGPSN